MFIEVAELRIKPGDEEAFEAGVAQAVPLFRRAKGCHSINLHRVVETPNVYKLVVEWATLEDHMVGFRESEDFHTWRSLVSPYFEAPPNMKHERVVALAV